MKISKMSKSSFLKMGGRKIYDGSRSAGRKCKVGRRLLRRIYSKLSWCMTAGAVVALGGCGNVNLSWSEEVRLADGAVVVVDRSARGSRNLEIGGPGGWKASEMSLAIRSESLDTPAPPKWQGSLTPILLDFQPENGIWSIVATFHFCSTWHEMGKPSSPYVEYQTGRGQAWEQVPLEGRLIGRQSNLLTGPDADGEKRLLKISEKLEREKRASEQFKSVVSNWSGC